MSGLTAVLVFLFGVLLLDAFVVFVGDAVVVAVGDVVLGRGADMGGEGVVGVGVFHVWDHVVFVLS